MRITGRLLNARWRIGALHVLYHKDGVWYERLTNFPGALCDPSGYVLFHTESEFLNCPQLHIGKKVNVEGHLSRLPGYVPVAESLRVRP